MTRRIPYVLMVLLGAFAAGFPVHASAQQPSSPVALTPLTPVGNDGEAMPVSQPEQAPVELTPAPPPSELPADTSDVPPASLPPLNIQAPANASPAEAPLSPQIPGESTPPADASATPAPATVPETEPAPAKVEEPVQPVTEEDKKKASMLGYQPSYGTWPFSIMFREKEVSDIKKVLDYYEIQKYQAAKTADPKQQENIEQVEDILKNAPTNAPVIYPVFQLRSLVYQSPKEWSIVVNNTRFNSRDPLDKNAGNDLKILSLNKEIVYFSWIPADPKFYADMIQKKILRDQNIPSSTAGTAAPGQPAAPMPLVAVSYANRIATNAPRPLVDDALRGVTFRLRPNQTINMETLEIFEGRPPNLVIPGDPKKDELQTIAPAAVLPAELQGQIQTGAPPPAEGQVSPPADATATEPMPGSTSESITKEDTSGLLNGKSSPKSLIEKALELEGKQ